MATYFIGEGEIKELTDISKHVPFQYLEPYISTIQETVLKPILGAELHDEIIAQIAANTLTAANTTLLTYIQKAHAYHCYAKYAIRGNFISTATGFKKKFSTESENPTMQELAIVHKDIKSDAEFWTIEMSQYLEDNKEDYPLYESSCRAKAKPGFGIF